LRKSKSYLLTLGEKKRKFETSQTVNREQIYKKKNNKKLLITKCQCIEEKKNQFDFYKTRCLVYVGNVCLKNPISLRIIFNKNK